MSPITRRAALGTLLGIATGGCLEVLRQPPTVEEANRSVRSVPSMLVPGSKQPFEVRAIGRGRGDRVAGAEPHSVWIWSEGDDERRLALTLFADGDPVFDRGVRFPAGGVFAFDLFAPRNYDLSIGYRDAEATVAVDDGQFDCNASATDVAVGPDGEVRTREISQDLNCGPL